MRRLQLDLRSRLNQVRYGLAGRRERFGGLGVLDLIFCKTANNSPPGTCWRDILFDDVSLVLFCPGSRLGRRQCATCSRRGRRACKPPSFLSAPQSYAPSIQGPFHLFLLPYCFLFNQCPAPEGANRIAPKNHQGQYPEPGRLSVTESPADDKPRATVATPSFA